MRSPGSVEPRWRHPGAVAASRALGVPRGKRRWSVERCLVPMADGTDLLTDVHAPSGPALGTVLMRTPYGLDGTIAALTAGFFASHGYRVVNQSCRGTGGSGGTLDPFSQEVDDGADAVAWLRRQSWFDGRFALWGASYLGHAAWAVMADPPPELVAAVVAISAHDGYWAAHGAGAFSLEETVGLMDGLGHLDVHGVRGLVRAAGAGRRLGPAFEELPLARAQDTVLADSGMPYRDWLTATSPDDPLWRSMRLGRALERIDVPVLLQTGWQERFAAQVLEEYDVLQRRRVPVGLTVGPWTHAQAVTTGAKVLMADALDWLGEHLAGTASDSGSRRRASGARIFVTGAGEWRHMDRWPPPTELRALYLQPGGGLDEALPVWSSDPTAFLYDPADATPGVGGRVINPAIGGSRDNRDLEARADVLTFTTAPLTEDWEVMGGPIAELVHNTDNPYADLFVRLCEVREDGRSVNLSDGFRRLGPDDANGTVEVHLDAVAHRFTAGVRIRLQVSGGAHPRYARNLGTDEDPATGTTMRSSHRRIHHGDGGPSRIVLPCAR